MPRHPGAVELPERRTPNGKHFRNSNGTHTAEFRATPGGPWKDKAPGFRSTGVANEYVSDQSDVVMRTFQVGTGGNRRWWVEFTEKLTGQGIRFELQYQPTPDAINPQQLNFTSSEGTWSYTHTFGGGKMLGPSTPAPVGTRSYSFRYELVSPSGGGGGNGGGGGATPITQGSEQDSEAGEIDQSSEVS